MREIEESTYFELVELLRKCKNALRIGDDDGIFRLPILPDDQVTKLLNELEGGYGHK